MNDWSFPFGQAVRKVEQTDRSPKKTFVLGVYASAVHARWENPQGKTLVNALAVASEPYIFWRGENAEEIIQEIEISSELGRLVSAAQQFNGPSGTALDELILKPLGLTRAETWLCDLVPHSCMNPAQQRAIERVYVPNIEQYQLPRPSLPSVPRKLSDPTRRAEILEELVESGADVLILLGDQPIRWFLKFFDSRWQRLTDFTDYGEAKTVKISGKAYQVIALAHPRQIAKLGKSSQKWYEVHQTWIKNNAP